jgi:thiosulfate/3-mercaptopyruvate sulfurtransferase
VDNYLGEDIQTWGIERGGHIPTAVNVPATRVADAENTFLRWEIPTTNDDGTYKSFEELRALFSEKGVTPDKCIITYCVRGGLSTHMWIALTQLLGYPNVREYYPSWEEWGNIADTPIEK